MAPARSPRRVVGPRHRYVGSAGHCVLSADRCRKVRFRADRSVDPYEVLQRPESRNLRRDSTAREGSPEPAPPAVPDPCVSATGREEVLFLRGPPRRSRPGSTGSMAHRVDAVPVRKSAHFEERSRRSSLRSSTSADRGSARVDRALPGWRAAILRHRFRSRPPWLRKRDRWRHDSESGPAPAPVHSCRGSFPG